MKIKFKPIYATNNEVTKYTQPTKDVLVINDEFTIDMSNETIDVFNITSDVSPYIIEAKRIDGELNLILVMFYRDKNIWEKDDWNGTKNYRGYDYETFDIGTIS